MTWLKDHQQGKHRYWYYTDKFLPTCKGCGEQFDADGLPELFDHIDMHGCKAIVNLYQLSDSIDMSIRKLKGLLNG